MDAEAGFAIGFTLTLVTAGLGFLGGIMGIAKPTGPKPTPA